MFTGILKDWVIFTTELLDGKQIVLATVHEDHKGRFNKNDWMKTSPIVSFDETTRVVKTRNSTYQLAGDGVAVSAGMDFFNTFVRNSKEAALELDGVEVTERYEDHQTH